MDIDSHHTPTSSSRRRAMVTSEAAAHWENDAERYGFTGPLADELRGHRSFAVPSYLRGSRYLERLKRWDEKRIADLQERAAAGLGSGLGTTSGTRLSGVSRSASSSSVNLNKSQGAAAYGHHQRNNVMQDVVERSSPLEADDERMLFERLPSRLSSQDKQNGLDILAEGLEAKLINSAQGSDYAASVRADHPMLRECGIFYYEVTVLSKSKDPGVIGIGFSGPKASLSRLPGWESDSWGYHSDDGDIFSQTPTGKHYGLTFGREDIIGCGINFRTGSAFFTKNGVNLGTAFTDITSPKLYPAIGMKKPMEHLRVNFGKLPFAFDIDSMMENESRAILRDISESDVTSLSPPDDEDSLIHNLIGQYLAHEGYVETAKAFAKDVHEQEQYFPSKRRFRLSSEEDDIHAIQRQKIRRSILDGDIDRAMKFTNSHYPRVLEDDTQKDSYFHLRCQKFIEMMKKHTELIAASSTAESPVTVTKGDDDFGVHGRAEHVPTQDIDLEEPEHDHDDDDDDEEEEEEYSYVERGGNNNRPGQQDQNEEDEEEEEEEEEQHQDTQMELDDQLQREASWSPTKTPSQHHHSSSSPLFDDDVDMDASREQLPLKASKVKADDLMAAAIVYGQELQHDFSDSLKPQNQKLLQDIFSIVAYSDVMESPLAYLFDAKRRVSVAEEVNGSILLSLGKNQSSALETLCAQTEYLIDLVSKTGGSAAFVNMRRQFLQP